jgi:hypothetical protein
LLRQKLFISKIIDLKNDDTDQTIVAAFDKENKNEYLRELVSDE